MLQQGLGETESVAHAPSADRPSAAQFAAQNRSQQGRSGDDSGGAGAEKPGLTSEKCRTRGRSGWQDSNLRPPAPKAGALPDCATPRNVLRYPCDRFAARVGELAGAGICWTKPFGQHGQPRRADGAAQATKSATGPNNRGALPQTPPGLRHRTQQPRGAAPDPAGAPPPDPATEGRRPSPAGATPPDPAGCERPRGADLIGG